MKRSRYQVIFDFLTFPLRAVSLFYQDKWGLSCLASERFDYVSREVQGYCLDVGCGPRNRFIREYLSSKGKGIDVFPYAGLTAENLVDDIKHFPFPDASFDTITFIANINHIPRSLRDVELKETYRCLKIGGNIVVTMGNPLAEIMMHKIVHWYDSVFGTQHDLDSERGMHEDEEYYLKDSEILARLSQAGFRHIKKKFFFSQWGLNHLFVAWKN